MISGSKGMRECMHFTVANGQKDLRMHASLSWKHIFFLYD